MSLIRFRALVLLLVLPALAPLPGTPVLVPGDAVEGTLAGGEVKSYRLEMQTRQHLEITVAQDGVDLALRIQNANGTLLGTMDAAEDRRGFERWLLSTEAGEAFQVEVRAVFAVAPPGRFRITVREVPDGDPALAAARLMTEADLLFSQEAAEPRQQALDRYRSALEKWREFGSRKDEARTLLHLAVAHQVLGQWPAMLERLEEALSLVVGLRDRGGEGDTLNYRGLAQIGLCRYRDALASFERSLEMRRALADRYGEAQTAQNMCLVRLHLGEWREAISCYEKTLDLLKIAEAPVDEAFNGVGGAYFQVGELRKAQENYTRALELKRASHDRAGEAVLLNNLGLLHAEQGDLGKALDYYGQALEVYRTLGNREREARLLSNLGNVYLHLGDPQRALDLFEQALPIRRELKDLRGELNTLDSLGLAYQRIDQVDKAIQAFEQALKIARQIEDPAGEAASLNLLAQGRVKAGDLEGALKILTESVALQRRLEYRGALALALQRTGEVEARLGRREKALASLKESLELNRSLEDRSGQAASLASMAKVESELDRFDDALKHADEAIHYIESVRSTVSDPNLRASFLGSQQLAFELAIALRMELDPRQPGKVHAEEALALSERARARSLLDLLNEARTEVRQGLDPRLREREETLAERFNGNAKSQRSATTEAQRANARRELIELLSEADRLEEDIRRQNPHYAALSEPLSAAAIRQLLDPETLLLEYSLGEERSFLWAVTSERVEGFSIAGRQDIERSAREVYQQVGNLEDASSGAEAARRLSQALLGPVADRLQGKRLVIVADGALHYVPFAALPEPGRPDVALIDGHEIVLLPSASVLDIQRRSLAGRAKAEKAVAIFADPIFTPWDSRLRRPSIGTRPAALRRTAGGPETSFHLQRLPATGREAAAVEALLPQAQVFKSLGLQASRKAVLAADLTRYRVVHFATHGLIDSETPRLSALALSLFDENGEAQEGLLGLSDVYSLKLGADLVVLSGCETGLGREIRGEGLVGLTQGFLYAGAERVMASLWRVEDEATAELMSRFYRAMLLEGKPPATALRSAQLAVRGDPRWRDSFFWAPFVLQGDWR